MISALRRRISLFAVACVLVVGGGGAFAAIPDADDGEFHLCRTGREGRLQKVRVFDAESNPTQCTDAGGTEFTLDDLRDRVGDLEGDTASLDTRVDALEARPDLIGSIRFEHRQDPFALTITGDPSVVVTGEPVPPGDFLHTALVDLRANNEVPSLANVTCYGSGPSVLSTRSRRVGIEALGNVQISLMFETNSTVGATPALHCYRTPGAGVIEATISELMTVEGTRVP